ncbi:MAG: RNA polymerase sigma factor [bacterium]
MRPKCSARQSTIEPSELRDWYDATLPQIYRYIYRRVQNREEAEDITQDTYVRTLARHPAPASLPTPGYLRTVALNLIRDRWRRRQVRGTPLPLTETLLAAADDSDAVLRKETVQEAMNALPPEYRQIIQLRIVEGYSRAETARLTGRSEDAVRGMQYRALQQLRKILLPEGRGDSR